MDEPEHKMAAACDGHPMQAIGPDGEPVAPWRIEQVNGRAAVTCGVCGAFYAYVMAEESAKPILQGRRRRGKMPP